ncbi:MAG: hypothetical protein LBR36_03775 [Bacteroidales bacterium]|nr:hypothetical protein [Bacteroidales bacterium]
MSDKRIRGRTKENKGGVKLRLKGGETKSLEIPFENEMGSDCMSEYKAYKYKDTLFDN